MADQRKWLVTCRDAAGRRRNLTVLASKGSVVLVAPPGETAILAPLEIGRLRATLREAVVVAAGQTPEA